MTSLNNLLFDLIMFLIHIFILLFLGCLSRLESARAGRSDSVDINIYVNVFLFHFCSIVFPPKEKDHKSNTKNIGVILWRTINYRKRFLFSDHCMSSDAARIISQDR